MITPRENEIIDALLEGKSNREISKTVFMSEKTCKNHLTNLYKKIGVKNRVQLACWALVYR